MTNLYSSERKPFNSFKTFFLSLICIFKLKRYSWLKKTSSMTCRVDDRQRQQREHQHQFTRNSKAPRATELFQTPRQTKMQTLNFRCKCYRTWQSRGEHNQPQKKLPIETDGGGSEPFFIQNTIATIHSPSDLEFFEITKMHFSSDTLFQGA